MISKQAFLKLCCNTDNTDVEKCLDNNNCTNQNIYSALSAKDTTLEAFKYLIIHVYDNTKIQRIMLTLCKNNKLEHMKELVSVHNDIRINVTKLIEVASNLKYFEIVKWLLTFPPYMEHSTIRNCLKFGKADLMKSLVTKSIKIFADDLVEAMMSDIEWKEKVLIYKKFYQYNPRTVGKLLNKCDYNSERYYMILQEFDDLMNDDYKNLIKEIYDVDKILHLANKYKFNIDEQICNLKIENFDLIKNYYDNDITKFQVLLDTYVTNKNMCMIKKFLIWCETQAIHLDTTIIQNKIKSRDIRNNTDDGIWLYNKFTIKVGYEYVSLYDQKSTTKKRKREEDKCCVCLEESDAYTNCEHNICKSCVSQLHNTICPVCRSSIESITNQQRVIIIDQ